jgi:hypothetical protein
MLPAKFAGAAPLLGAWLLFPEVAAGFESIAPSFCCESVALSAFPNIKYTSHSIVFWDEEHNFYHIDSSKVFTPNVPYYTHTWILYKNVNGTMKQSQAIDIAVHKATSDTPDWTITLPELDNAQIELKVAQIIDTSSHGFSGLLEGTITDARGTRKIHGYGSYENKK